jgi:hypothetical protein
MGIEEKEIPQSWPLKEDNGQVAEKGHKEGIGHLCLSGSASLGVPVAGELYM